MTRLPPPEKIRRYPKSRVWFYKPEWWWGYERAWLPIRRGHDEYSRRTLLLGWSITGRIVIALGYCGYPDCYMDTLDDIQYLEEHPEEDE